MFPSVRLGRCHVHLDEECARSEERRRINAGADEDVRMDAGEDEKENKWSIRRDVKLGDRNYRLRDRRGKEWGVREVRESVHAGSSWFSQQLTSPLLIQLNGLCFSPCGTRVFAGETSGNIFAWEYPILPPAEIGTHRTDVPEETGPDESAEDGKDIPTAQPSGTVTPARSGDGRNGSPEREEREQEDGEMLGEEGNAEKMDEVNAEPSTADTIANLDDDAVKGGDAGAMQLDDVDPEMEDAKQEIAEESTADPAVNGLEEKESSSPGLTADGDVNMGESSKEATSSNQPTNEQEKRAVAGETALEPEATSAPNEQENLSKEGVDAEGDAEMADALIEGAVQSPAEPDSKAASRPEGLTTEQIVTAPPSSEEHKPAAPQEGTADAKMAEDKPAAVATAPVEPSKPKVPEIQAKMLKYLFQVGCHSGCGTRWKLRQTGGRADCSAIPPTWQQADDV